MYLTTTTLSFRFQVSVSVFGSGFRFRFRFLECLLVSSFAGPIAINWMAVTSDPWAVQQVAEKFGENYCIKFLVPAFAELAFTTAGNRFFANATPPFLPYNVSTIDTALDVAFPDPGTDGVVCCKQYQIP